MVTYTITVRTKANGDSIKTLRAILKVLLRRFGLRAIKVEETPERAIEETG
jgi:hypothetical protein